METFPTVLIITMILEELEAGSSKIRESPGNSKSLCALRRATLHETEGDMAVLLFSGSFRGNLHVEYIMSLSDPSTVLRRSLKERHLIRSSFPQEWT
jgi:hypothetical protein